MDSDDSGHLGRATTRWPVTGTPLDVSLIALILAVLGIEAICRAVGYDFNHQEALWNRQPIYYRYPRVPAGETFFRRQGPDHWYGQVLATGYRESHRGAQAYTDEKPVSIDYDAQGFRNPLDLRDWDIAVLGDSFVELGFLPYDDLFSTVLGRRLGVSVKNLGVGYTGPLSYLYYFSAYGRSSHTQRALMVFFEGNDLADLNEEMDTVQKYETTRSRPLRSFKKQTSFLRALEDFVRSFRKEMESRQAVTPSDGFFRSTEGDIPVTLDYKPQSRETLDAGSAQYLSAVLEEWARRARAARVEPWVVYMPSKLRVLHGYLKEVSSSFAEWQPSTDLPALVQENCKRNGIRFVDVTNDLRKVAASGVLPYNPIWDTHLNRVGSLTVGEALAAALKE